MLTADTITDEQIRARPLRRHPQQEPAVKILTANNLDDEQIRTMRDDAWVRYAVASKALGIDPHAPHAGYVSHNEKRDCRARVAEYLNGAAELDQPGKMFNGFDGHGCPIWVSTADFTPDVTFEGRRYYRNGKLGRLARRERDCGTIGEPIAEYRDERDDRLCINLDGDVVAVHS